MLGERRAMQLACAGALVPLVMVLVATEHGIGISPDSVTYASTLRYRENTGEWSFSSLFPPGLPFVVAVVGLKGALLVNLLALWGFLVSSYVLALRVTRSIGLALGVLGWLSASLATTQLFAMLWTEPVFCVMVNVALLSLTTLQRRRTVAWPSVVGLIVALNVACLFRYAGAALVAFAALCLLTTLDGRPLRRLVTAGLIGAAGSISLCATLAWNLTLTGEPMGPRLASVSDTSALIAQLLAATVRWATNVPLSELDIAVGLPLVALYCLAQSRWLKETGLRNAVLHPQALLLAWTSFYLAFICWTSLTTRVIRLDSRLLAPILVSAAVTAAFLLTRVSRSRIRQALPAVAIGYIGFLFAIQLLWVQYAEQNGLQYASPSIASLDLAGDVRRTVPRDAVLVSNDPVLLAWITGRDAIRGAPDAGPPAPEGSVYTLDVAESAQPGDYLVWIRDLGKGKLPARDLLSTVTRGDGYDIYLVRDPAQARLVRN